MTTDERISVGNLVGVVENVSDSGGTDVCFDSRPYIFWSAQNGRSLSRCRLYWNVEQILTCRIGTATTLLTSRRGMAISRSDVRSLSSSSDVFALVAPLSDASYRH